MNMAYDITYELYRYIHCIATYIVYTSVTSFRCFDKVSGSGHVPLAQRKVKLLLISLIKYLYPSYMLICCVNILCRTFGINRPRQKSVYL